jgi:hypothetical protein
MPTTQFDIHIPPAPLGFVDMALGAVFALRANGDRFLLSRGDPVFGDDVLETGRGGAVCLAIARRGRLMFGEGERVAVGELAAAGGT